MNIGKSWKNLKSSMVLFFNETPTQNMLRTFFAAVIALAIGYNFTLLQDYWAVLTVLLLMQLRVHVAWQKNSVTMIALGCLMALTAIAANYLALNPYGLAVYLAFTTFASIYIGLQNVIYFFPAYSINMVGALSAGIPTSLHGGLLRANCILLGTVVAVLMTVVLWPPRPHVMFKQYCVDSLRALNKFQKIIFSLYIKHNYLSNRDKYEMQIHQCAEKLAIHLQALRKLTQDVALADERDIANNLNDLFDLFMMLSSLRYRVIDHTIFEVCIDEMKIISKKMQSSLSALIKQFTQKNATLINLQPLEESIYEFEGIYRGALQVITPDPLLFLIFIHQLWAVQEKLALLTKDASQL